jgi:hypothetical protein
MISIMDRSSASWKFIALKLDHMSHFGPSYAITRRQQPLSGRFWAARRNETRLKIKKEIYDGSFSTQKRASK